MLLASISGDNTRSGKFRLSERRINGPRSPVLVQRTDRVAPSVKTVVADVV